MNKLILKSLTLGLMVLVGGCVSVNYYDDDEKMTCINANMGNYRSSEVVGDNTLLVSYGARKYMVEVGSQCDLSDVGRVSLSYGPERMMYTQQHGNIWVSNMPFGNSFCGRPMERVVIRGENDDLRDPGQHCEIKSIKRRFTKCLAKIQ